MSYKNPITIIASIFLSLILSCSSPSKPHSNEEATVSTDSIASIVDSTSTIFKEEETIADSLLFPDNEKSIVKILQTGKFNPREIDNNTVNEKWIGLFKIGSLYFLRPTSLEIVPTTDTNASIVRQVLMVNTSVYNRCLILISGLEELSSKDLKTAQRDKDTIFPGEEINFNLKNNTYLLKAEGKVNKNNDGTFEINSYKLFAVSIINGVEVKQMLVAQPLLKNQMISILWTGDIDGDDKLDLIINASPTKGTSTPALYLSSKAKRGDLVKFVGQHFAK